MAHFAELNNTNVVKQVIVVANEEVLDNGVESEAKGVAFCKLLFGSNTNWKQTSYNGNFRKNYAGIGYTYDSVLDAFIPLKPFESWVLNEETCQWEAPIARPSDSNGYRWNEELLSWDKI
jgi:hypothetical protein